MQELINNHGRRHEVRCLSHAGHVMPWKNDNRDFTLQEQIDQKAFYIKQRLSEDPTLRLVVIGYPIGSYITLDVANRFPERISKLVLMQPAIIHIALSRKGKQFMTLMNNYEFAVDVDGTSGLSCSSFAASVDVLGMAANEMAEVVELDEKLVT
ncbi:Lipid-droplet associated hydrolase [Phytophthora infestans]|nr:Lipid-droplet associated hydrolase [Phytophthora infestans]KAF4132282.1 Lipid-droplet associated hydrolase [Phytophthora infestans]